MGSSCFRGAAKSLSATYPSGQMARVARYDSRKMHTFGLTLLPKAFLLEWVLKDPTNMVTASATRATLSSVQLVTRKISSSLQPHFQMREETASYLLLPIPSGVVMTTINDYHGVVIRNAFILWQLFSSPTLRWDPVGGNLVIQFSRESTIFLLTREYPWQLF